MKLNLLKSFHVRLLNNAKDSSIQQDMNSGLQDVSKQNLGFRITCERETSKHIAARPSSKNICV